MKLYTNPLSPNCRKVMIALNELGDAVSCDVEVIDLRSGAHKQPDYLALNPNGKVPTLVDGDFKLWESNAICQYLAELAGSSLWPSDPKGRADVSRWMAWQLAHLGPAIDPYIAQNLFAPMRGDAPDTDVLAQASENLHRYLNVLDKHLASGGPFVTGDTYTLADISISASLAYCEAAKVPVVEHGHVVGWRRSISERPSWAASAPPQLG